jgi:class 3 adenylate cyclase
MTESLFTVFLVDDDAGVLKALSRLLRALGPRLVDQDKIRNARRTSILFRLSEINFTDDGPGKPVGINEQVGRRAIAAFGNSDGDLESEVINAYHRSVAETVAMFDGFVAKYMGDGVLVYFGYPRAHEYDAERAVRAGLGAIEAVGRLDVKSTKLQVRIATGLVVVGDMIGEGSAQAQSLPFRSLFPLRHPATSAPAEQAQRSR